jgi:hypothetical protein
MSTYSELQWEAENERRWEALEYEHESHTSAGEDCRLCEQDAEERELEELEEHADHEVCGLDRYCTLCENDHDELHSARMGGLYRPRYTDCVYCEDRWYNAQQVPI